MKVDIKEEFHNLYNSIARTAGLSKAKKQRLDNYRNQMAVDFYNLIPAKTKKPIDELWEEYENQIDIFRNKYLLQGIKIGCSNGKSSDYSKLIMYKLVAEHQNFSRIVNKAIEITKIDKKDLEFIDKRLNRSNLLQFELENGTFILFIEPNEGIYRALYEWVVLLFNGKANVNRCEEATCKKLYIPTARGHDQKYCADACKMKSYRRQNKKA